jgi:predicted ester cyclase
MLDRRTFLKKLGGSVAAGVAAVTLGPALASASAKEAPVSQTRLESQKDRVSRLRKHIEEGGENDLFSHDYVNKAPWHRARLQPETLLSDARLSVEDAVAGGDKVVVRWRMRGTWTKPYMGINPTNKPINVSGINIYRFVGDKIVESTGEFGLAGLVAQAFSENTGEEEQCAEALQTVSRGRLA